MRILQYGDSHTASDASTGVLRRLLQARFGDGGRGFVSLGKPWKTYMQEGIRGGMTSEFEPEKAKLKDGQFVGDGCYGLLGVGVGTSKGGARAWTEIAPRSSRVEIAYWQEPRGGSVDVFIDGARAGRIATRATQPGSGFFAFDVPDAPHEVELRTVGDGQVRVFGMALDRAQAGVVVDALGINGAQRAAAPPCPGSRRGRVRHQRGPRAYPHGRRVRAWPRRHARSHRAGGARRVVHASRSP